jgi:hypothetical protein
MLGLLVDTGMSYPPATVCSVGPLITLFSSLVLSLPMLAVLIVGLVLVSSRGRLPARSATLARGGLLLMLLNEALSLIWSVLFPHVVVRNGYRSGTLTIRAIGYLSSGVSFVLGTIFAAGLALLIAGLVTGRRADAPPAYGRPAPDQPVGYTPPYGVPAPDTSASFAPIPASGVPSAVPVQPTAVHTGDVATGETGRIFPDAQDPWSGDHRAQ